MAALLTLLAFASLALAAPSSRVLRFAQYGTASQATAFVPSTPAPAGGFPLVIMLSGYCLQAELQDNMQLGYKALAEQRGFVYLPLKSPKAVKSCALCPTTVAAIRAANRSQYPSIQMYIQGERLTAAATAAGSCTAWDATPACCSENEGKGGGDTAFLASLIRQAKAELSIGKVYIVGIANGATPAAQT